MKNALRLGFRSLQASAQTVRFFPAIPHYIRTDNKKLSVGRSFNGAGTAIRDAARQHTERKNGK